MTHIKSVACSSEQFTWRSGIWLCMKHIHLGNTFTQKRKQQMKKNMFDGPGPKELICSNTVTDSYPNFPGQWTGTSHVSCVPLGQPHKTNKFSFQFFSSLWFLWFPVPVCLKQSKKVTKCKSFGVWMCGESQTASPVKSNSGQAQSEDERLSWENKQKAHDV